MKQLGMSLIELTVVLLILVALAGLTLPYVRGVSSKALCDATDVSMANIKRAIMDRYYVDMLGKFPQNLKVLTVAGTPKYNLHYLFSDTNLSTGTDDRTHKSFDPDSAVGWRSDGYLQGGFTLTSDLAGNFDDTDYTDPLLANHTVVLDSWGRPIVIQKYTAGTGGFRLISAGPDDGVGLGNGNIETAIASVLTSSFGRDRILYLTARPAGAVANPVCN